MVAVLLVGSHTHTHICAHTHTLARALTHIDDVGHEHGVPYRIGVHTDVEHIAVAVLVDIAVQARLVTDACKHR